MNVILDLKIKTVLMLKEWLWILALVYCSVHEQYLDLKGWLLKILSVAHAFWRRIQSGVRIAVGYEYFGIMVNCLYTMIHISSIKTYVIFRMLHRIRTNFKTGEGVLLTFLTTTIFHWYTRYPGFTYAFKGFCCSFIQKDHIPYWTPFLPHFKVWSKRHEPCQNLQQRSRSF